MRLLSRFKEPRKYKERSLENANIETKLAQLKGCYARTKKSEVQINLGTRKKILKRSLNDIAN